MNKQAFTFLTLFSLILVLSVYYIMLPPITVKEVVNTNQTTIEILQKDLEKKRESIISKNNQIIAKESSTSESINLALQTISEVKNQSEQEKQIVEKVKALGYSEVYIEIDDSVMKVTALKKDATKTDASRIMNEIMKTMGDEFKVEVKFISE